MMLYGFVLKYYYVGCIAYQWGKSYDDFVPL